MKLHIEYGDETKDFFTDGSFSIHIKDLNPLNDFYIFNFTFLSKKVELADSFTVKGKTVEIINCDWNYIEQVIPNYRGDLLCEIDYNGIRFTITK